MSVIPPKSSELLAGSSVGFKKPMPRRDRDARADQEDSAEFDVGLMNNSPQAAIDLWRKLLPDPNDPDASSVSCAGLMLGHFCVEEQIGRGGMGAVFRAVDTRLDRDVALKVLAGTQLVDKSSVDRFLNEARAAARLDHDNVARVYYVGQDHGLHFIAFEFIHGANVRQVIEARGSLSPAETVNIGLQIAHALRHIAAAGVVHRDVKPSNIIITPTGRAKLVDLGLARKVDPEASKDLTVDGTTLGTFDYISPEQAKDPRSVDIRSDVYSLGCTLYHMLTGEPPYPRGTMLQKLLDHQHKDVPEASTRNSNVPPELSAVVRKMMASDPGDRYESADELIGDLSILAHAYGLRPLAAESLVWGVPGRPNGWSLLRRYRVWIATAALLVLGVVAFDFVQAERNDGQPTRTEPAAVATTGLSTEANPSDPVERTPPTAPSESDGAIVTWPPASVGGLDVSEDDAGSIRRAEPRPSATAAPDTGPTPTDVPRITSLKDIFSPSFLDDPFNFSASDDGLAPNERSADEPVEHNAESTAETTVSKPSVEPVVPVVSPSAPFVVRIDGESPQDFATLEAACSAAPDGSAIELNFDGPSVERQRPVKIVGKRLRLRRAADRRPIIRFAVPDGWRNAEIVRMITVTRGSLEVYGVGFEMTVDTHFLSSEGWVLLALAEADEVILRGVSVTISSAQDRPAAIVELAERSSRIDGRMPEVMDRLPVRFEAEDCLFRGEADLFRSANVDPARVRLSNVAVALDGSLLDLSGMDAMDVPSDANGDRRIELDLRHITALLSGNVVRFQIDAGRTVPKVSVIANNSILVNGTSPLASISGELDLYEAQELMEWSGDHSFIESQDPVWHIVSPFETWDCGLDEWNELWRQGRLERPVGTNLLRRDRSIPYHLMTRDDLRLVSSDESPNPASGGASDGTNAGVQWGSPRLPRMADVGDSDDDS